MTVTERRIPVPGGDLAVIDHGGSGPDVLLLHSSGHNAHTWADLAPLLARHAHVYALDLRGHGQSTAQVTDGSAQIRDDVLTVVAELGLRRPVIVGHEFGGLWAVAAAYEHEELGGLVLIDSPVVDPTDAVRDLVSMIADPVVLDLLVERFGLGVSGPDAASLDEYADGYVERIRSDWLARTFDADAARQLVLRGVLVAPDGSWSRQPSIEAVKDLAAIPAHYPYYPGRELIETLDAPILVVTLSQGHFVPSGDAVQLAATHPDWQVVTLDAHAEALTTDPEIVLDPIVAFLESSSGTT